MRQTLFCACSVALFAAGANASTVLFGIGADNAGVPRAYYSISIANSTAALITDLGDGSVGFNGGMVSRPSDGQFYVIGNDNAPAGTLSTLSAAGSLNTVGLVDGLPAGFIGGLALDTDNGFLYGIETDSGGNSTLIKISASSGQPTVPGNVLGTNYTGVAFDPNDHLFYAIATDSNGASTLYDFSLGGAPSQVGLTGGLGFGVGGLTFDPVSNLLYAVANQNNFGSELERIDLNGNASVLFGLPDGFTEVAAEIPEPSSAVLLLAGIAWIIVQHPKLRLGESN
jgi:hypothetical protein